METYLPKYKLKKQLKHLPSLKKVSLATKNYNLLLTPFLLFLSLFVYVKPFVDSSMMHWPKGEIFSTGLNLLETICYSGKNFYSDRIESCFYIYMANAFYYRQIYLVFAEQKNIIYLAIVFSITFTKACLPATQSLLQAK